MRPTFLYIRSLNQSNRLTADERRCTLMFAPMRCEMRPSLACGQKSHFAGTEHAAVTFAFICVDLRFLSCISHRWHRGT